MLNRYFRGGQKRKLVEKRGQTETFLLEKFTPNLPKEISHKMEVYTNFYTT